MAKSQIKTDHEDTNGQASAGAEQADGQDADRRLDERKVADIPCTFVTGNGDIVGGVTRDLSASGVAVSSPVKPAKGSQIHLHFDATGVHAGEISRVFDDGFAVAFSGSSLAILALIDD